MGLEWILRKCSSPRGCSGIEHALQGIVTAPRLPEIQEALDTAPRIAQGGIDGVSVQGHELNCMAPVGHFQLGIFSASMTMPE